MENKSFRLFSQVSEEDILGAWYASKSRAEVKRRLNITNFGSKEKRLNEMIKQFKLPPFHLKKVEDLLASDFENAFNDTDVTTLKELCVKLGIAKKMHNSELKVKIQSENLDVPDRLHKAIFGVSTTPWTYPRRCFVKQNRLIPSTCSQCNFEATVPQQIQIHHSHSEESSLLNDNKTDSNEQSEVFLEKKMQTALSKKKYSGSSLKKGPNYNISKELTTICANCHSLEHHTRGLSEKEACGLWRTKKTTNLPFLNPMDMFVKNCLYKYTIQKKHFIRFFLKTPDDYRCYKCKASEWVGHQLVLQVHHKDSDPRNAELTNLVLLCPNCHAACHGDSDYLSSP